MVIEMKKELLAARLRQEMDELSHVLDELQMGAGPHDAEETLRSLNRELRWLKYVA